MSLMPYELVIPSKVASNLDKITSSTHTLLQLNFLFTFFSMPNLINMLKHKMRNVKLRKMNKIVW